jgi:hypothetical protein
MFECLVSGRCGCTQCRVGFEDVVKCQLALACNFTSQKWQSQTRPLNSSILHSAHITRKTISAAKEAELKGDSTRACSHPADAPVTWMSGTVLNGTLKHSIFTSSIIRVAIE